MSLISSRTSSMLPDMLLATAFVAALLPAIGSADAAETPPTIVLDLDHSRMVSLPKVPHRIIVGDPALVRVTVLPDGVSAVLTGTDRGETTMVVLDDRGAPIMQSTIRVESASDADIFVQRGLERRSYHCAPLCRLVDTVGDGGGADAKTSNGTTSHSTNSNPTQSAGGRGL
jgi:Flp pilus assembly secretin CpaC